MFGKKKEQHVLSDHDAQLLLDSIDNIISGGFDDINPADFDSSVIGGKLNSMLFSMKQINNPVVMRLNETMSITCKMPVLILKILLTISPLPWEISEITHIISLRYHKM